MSKPYKSIAEQTKPADRFAVPMHGPSNNYLLVWGSDSKSDFVDVISVGPIEEIVSTKWDNVEVSSPLLGNTSEPPVGPLPNGNFTHEHSSVYFHEGDFASKPWRGAYPYVERSYVLGVIAEVRDARAFHTTSFVKQVSGKGVEGVRIMFNTSAYTQVDDQNRRKHASAYFQVSVLDENGDPVKTATSSQGASGTYYYCKNPTAVALTIIAPDGYEDKIWQYEVKMHTFGHNNGVPVSGTWSAATATELFRDTQRYDHVAYASGQVVSSDTSGQIPIRTYLVKGYKVQVPVFQDIGGTPTFLGEFTQQNSPSHAWNILAVLTDDKWAGDLPIDKINLNSFLEFEEYCAEDIGGERRFTFSQHLIKATNYYKLAAQMAGTADAKLYEDTQGRIGVLVDKQTDQRRLVTSYDIIDEKVKRTTVPNTKKTNYVQVEFEDKGNSYERTIIHEEDSESITKNGVIKQELKLDTCTILAEAERTAKKVLINSQYISDTYHLTLGPSHEDIQIGDILEVYDRKHANVNYCGKVAAGSTTGVINIDPKTPIDLSDIDTTTLEVAFWNGTDVIRGTINTWTENQITVSPALSEAPTEFLSFGVQQVGSGNLSPTLMKVMDLSDTKTGLRVGCVAYNDSLYAHVEQGSALVIPPTRYIPDVGSSEISSLILFRNGNNLTGQWSVLIGYNYSYNFQRASTDEYGRQSWNTIQSGILTTATTSIDFPFPLSSGDYRIIVGAISTDGQTTGAPVVATYTLSPDSGSTILSAPTDVGVFHSGDPDVINTSYTGRDFIIGWEMSDPGGDVKEFQLTLFQNSITHVITIEDPTQRTYQVSEQELETAFGEDFTRTFLVDVYAVDEEHKTSTSANASITNAPVVAPDVVVRLTGDVTLSTAATIPDDIVESVVYVWESSDINSTRPSDALHSRSEDLYNHNLSGNVIQQDGRDYVYEVGWVDSFGEVGANWSKSLQQFNPDFEVPDAPELQQVVPITETSVLIRWTHDLNWLINLRMEYRLVSTDTGNTEQPWTEFATNFVFPTVGGEADRGYDVGTGVGYVVITGLTRNRLYEFRCRASNVSSAFSDYSDTITGEPFTDAATSIDLESAIQDALDVEVADLITDAVGYDFDIDPRDLYIEGVIDAFANYETDAEIFKETNIRRTDDQVRIDEINQIRAELDGDGGVYSQISTNAAAIAASDAAFAARVTSVDANFATTNANVTANQTAIAAESSARASEISTVNATLGGVEADIVRIDEVLVGVEGGQATSITNLTIALNDEIADRISEISRVETAYVAADAVVSARVDTVEANLATEVSDRQAAITNVTNAYIAADAVVASSVSTVQSNLNTEIGLRQAAITATTQAYTDADTALGLRIDTVEADLVTEENARSAAITNVTNAYIAADAVIASRVTTLESTFDDPTTGVHAQIAAIQSVNTTQDTAIALNGTNITAEVNDRIAEISRVETAYAAADAAIISTADTLRVDVDGNTAGIASNVTAIANETSARISADNTLTAAVADNANEIAAARDEATAAIGYCEIGGNVSNHETKAACEGASGVWIEAPMATAMRQVEVVDSQGGSTTVGSFYQAFVDLNGDVTGRALIGVDSGGAFTGLEVVGGTNHSSIIFKGNTIKFQNTSGTDQLSYNSGDNKWKFAGDLEAASGTFSGTLSAANGTFAGTVYAQNIEGDVFDGIVKTTTYRNWNTTTPTPGSGQVGLYDRPQQISSVTVSSEPFERTIYVSSVNCEIIGSQDIQLELGGIASVKKEMDSGTPDGSQRRTTTLAPISAVIPANTSGTVTLILWTHNLTDYQTHESQDILWRIFKSGGSLS